MIITYFFFFFFKTSHPSSIKTWAWAWAWPRGIHRWWDWTGPLLFGGRAGNITRTCMCIVCVLYETIPGKKTHIVTRIPSASFSCSCSWLGYAMLLLFFFFFFFFSILILLLPLSGHTPPRLANQDPHQYGHRVLSV